MPTKQLPSNANLDHLRSQARDLLRAHGAREADAARRIREFHPRLGESSERAILDTAFSLSDAQLAIAREYGFASWPRLKTHVEGLRSPLAGRWVADLSQSQRRPEDDRMQAAALQVAVAEDRVSMIDIVTDSEGKERRHENTIHADGQEHLSENGYVVAAKWLDARTLEAVVRKDRREVARMTYQVSSDDATLLLSAVSEAHDGYPASEQVTVFNRR